MSSKSSTLYGNLKNIKREGSRLTFSNFKNIKNIKKNINVDVNIGSKSSVIVNIKDIIGKLNRYSKFRPFTGEYIGYFKTMINQITEIKDLKNQKYLNICMFYIDNFNDEPDKYLVYIYYNYKDLFFIYDNENEQTKLYDIGDLEPFEIGTLFNKNINILKKINEIKK